ncbi:MAG: SDR family NAD(P)-dependent oxidoreductase [Ilumatobacteraceae bacterium]
MAEFSGKIAIVTGSSSGIGEAVARRLGELGATVVVNSSSSVESGTAVAGSIGNGAVYMQADISKKDQCERLINDTVAQFGRLDILVNNAGWTTPIPHHDLDALTDEIFMKTFEVNVYGTWWLSKLAVPHLKKSEDGNIVNVTSIAGVRQLGSSMAYSMTKAALNQMTKLMAKSCWPVRVNAVAPGLIATPWTSDWGPQHEAVKSIAPLKRSGTPEDCADATLALLRSTYATGQIFVVDGGLTLVQ